MNVSSILVLMEFNFLMYYYLFLLPTKVDIKIKVIKGIKYRTVISYLPTKPSKGFPLVFCPTGSAF